MASVYVYTLLSVFIVSVASLVGIATLALSKDTLQKSVFALVSLAAGALIGGAFLHLIPEAFEEASNALHVSLAIIGGVLLFFIFEKTLHWHAHHDLEDDCHHCDSKHIGRMIILGDGMHNFIDGLIIGASYLAGIEVGIAATVAVVLHEIPQEIGDFGVLIHSGYTKVRALLLNFLSALTAVFGALLALVLGGAVQGIVAYLMPIAAGGFIYIAVADLIPEMHKVSGLKYSIIQFVFVLLGIGAMCALLFME